MGHRLCWTFFGSRLELELASGRRVRILLQLSLESEEDHVDRARQHMMKQCAADKKCGVRTRKEELLNPSDPASYQRYIRLARPPKQALGQIFGV